MRPGRFVRWLSCYRHGKLEHVAADTAGYLTNETLFSLTKLPRRLAVIGAGPIGCEMAQTFARFGSEVTLVEAMRQLLGREDQDAVQPIERALVRDGVRINCCAKITGVRKESDET